jgi:predicted dehydrogenase
MTSNLSNAGPSLSALVVGGGMITEEVVLPTVLQQKRLGKIASVTVVSRRASTIQHLQKIFPNQLQGFPDPATNDAEASHPDGFREAIQRLPHPGIVIVATPDHLHTPVILAAVEAGHHVVVEKPLCLKVAEAHQIAQAAKAKAVYVLTDYHKRYDPAIRGAGVGTRCGSSRPRATTLCRA